MGTVRRASTPRRARNATIRARLSPGRPGAESAVPYLSIAKLLFMSQPRLKAAVLGGQATEQREFPIDPEAMESERRVRARVKPSSGERAPLRSVPPGRAGMGPPHVHRSSRREPAALRLNVEDAARA